MKQKYLFFVRALEELDNMSCVFWC